MTAICKITGKERELPCSARECPLFDDCIVEFQNGRRKSKPKQTNADRIRVMSDEELAKLLLDADQGNFTVDLCDERFCDLGNCSHGCTAAELKWLKQPAKGD